MGIKFVDWFEDQLVRLRATLEDHWVVFQLFMAILTAFCFVCVAGFSPVLWNTYGVPYDQVIFADPAIAQQDSFIKIVQANISPVLLAFHYLMRKAYQEPIWYVFSVFLFKIIQHGVYVFLARSMGAQKVSSILIATGIMLLFSPFAAADGGTSGLFSSALTKTSVCSMLIVTAVAFFARKQLVLSAISFGLALHFHAFIGAVAICFCLIPFLFHLKREFTIRQLGFAVVAGVVVLSPVLYKGLFPGALGPYSLNPEDWFQIAGRKNDFYMKVHIVNYLGAYILPFIGYFAFCRAAHLKESFPLRVAHSMILFNLLFGPLSLGLDELHLSGYFFGKLSELYSVLNMRRIIWVPSLLAMFAITQHLRKASNNLGEQALLQATAVVCFSAIHFNTFYTYLAALVLAGVLAVKVSSQKTITLCLIALGYYVLTSYYADLKGMPNYIMADVLVLGALALIGVLEMFKAIPAQPLDRKFSLMVVLFMAFAIANLRHGLTMTQLNNIQEFGWSKRVNHQSIGKLAARGPHATPFRNGTVSEEVSLKVRELNDAKVPVLFPPELDFDRDLVQSPSFFYMPSILWLGIWSSKAAGYLTDGISYVYDEDIQALLGDRFELNFEALYKSFERIHASLPEQKIAHLFAEGCFGLFVSKTKYHNLHIASEIHQYYIYDGQGIKRGPTPCRI